MEKNHPVNEMMASTIQKIRETVDANTVIGEPIVVDDVTIIPVSKISFGFGTGGSELPSKTEQAPYGGGGGAGVKITPVCFLTVSGGVVRVLPMAAPAENSVDRIVEKIPEIMTMITEMKDKKKAKAEDNQ